MTIYFREIEWEIMGGPGYGGLAGSFESGTELSGSINCWDFLKWMRNY
jgi:hypothetical protein